VKKTYPQEYIQSINDLLKSDAPAFWEAMEAGSPIYGLRVNPLKANPDDLQQVLPEAIKPLPWSAQGIAIKESQGLGKHPYHTAGLYYLQEPSAMVPVAVLDPQPGEQILDLCAAPGGKTTQIQSRMKNRGVLIANDPNPKRVQSLSRNLERWGARNAAVICEAPNRINEHLRDYFDRILVDAPCSGEGTFRSDPGAIKKWSPNFIKRCCQIQDEILWYAGKMVKPGGVLVYSTCTFNQDENEGTISRFLEKDPDFSIEPIESISGYSPGIQLESTPAIDFSGAVRIWPHKTEGEGHFIVRLRKSDSTPYSPKQDFFEKSPIQPDHLRIYRKFYRNTLNSTPLTELIQPESNRLAIFGNRLYWIPNNMPSLRGLTVRHWGWWLGTIQVDKFIPSPALACALTPEDAQIVLEFAIEEPGLLTYLRGSPLSRDNLEGLPEGWILITCNGYSLGWGMLHQGRLKSYLPRWLRSN
jgi:NOL1/NOP2/sun family putative RNA methylase